MSDEDDDPEPLWELETHPGDGFEYSTNFLEALEVLFPHGVDASVVFNTATFQAIMGHRIDRAVTVRGGRSLVMKQSAERLRERLCVWQEAVNGLLARLDALEVVTYEELYPEAGEREEDRRNR
jgi:hypothetical protein